MKNLFFSLIALLLTATSFANSYPEIPPYAGDNKNLRPVVLDEYAALKPQIKSDSDKAKLQDAKQRFRNALNYYDKIDENIKKYNGNKSSSIKDYEWAFKRLGEIYLENSKNYIYDKEYIDLLSQNLKRQYDYWVAVYKEQGSEIFLKKIKAVNSFREAIKTDEYIVNH